MPILVLAALVDARGAAVRSIFILHSFSMEYAWTKGQHDGFLAALRNDPAHEFDFKVEFLGTKRTGYSADYAELIAGHLAEKYLGYQPAAIYVSDDNALSFALDHLASLFPAAPIFFSGVNDYGIKGRLDPNRVTGVFERKEFVPNLDLLHDTASATDALAIVGDASSTYDAIATQIREELRTRGDITPAFIANDHIEGLVAWLRAANTRFVFLTTLGAVADESGRILTLAEAIGRVVSAGDHTVLSMEDAYLFSGVLGGYVTSGPAQGRAAGKLLLRHLAGTPMAALKPIEDSPNEYVFDDTELRRSGIVLPPAINRQAVRINVMPTFYDTHRDLVILVV